MSKEVDAIALLPIEEFIKLDPEYWSEEANKHYGCDKYTAIDEASKRGLRRERERLIAKMEDGDIWKFNVNIPDDPRRPCIVLKIPGEQPLICFVCTTRSKHKLMVENVPIKTPLLWGELDHPNSHVAVNSIRYLNDLRITPKGEGPIGHVHPENLEEIKKRFIEVNHIKSKSLESFILDDDLDSLLSDI